MYYKSATARENTTVPSSLLKAAGYNWNWLVRQTVRTFKGIHSVSQMPQLSSKPMSLELISEDSNWQWRDANWRSYTVPEEWSVDGKGLVAGSVFW